jgi:hypothetical protein
VTDKFRRTHPLNITTADGEQPTGAKLSAIATQARVGARLLEKAVGDLWNQSGDSILADWPLQIPNLARTIGENKWMNPVIYPVEQTFNYRDNVGTKFTNQNHAYLQFKPSSTVTAVAGSTNLTNKVASEYLVVAAGDWWFDSTTGRLRSFSSLSASDKVDYTVDSSSWAITDATVPSVVPDPRQTEFTGCRISTDGTSYFIHLPPRRPLTLTGFDLPERYPSSSDIADNIATTVSPYKLWQSSGVSALQDSHYRYPLPKEIADIISELDDGADLPEGFICLWNQNTRTIVEDATFQKSDSGNWILRVAAPSQDLASKVSTSESQAAYNSTGYSLIFAGSPLTRAINTLNKIIQAGGRNNAGDFAALISHSALTGQNPPTSSYSGHGGRYPTTVPAWTPSRWAMDDHVSLLSRAGSQGTGGSIHRDVNDNAMMGHLVLASTTINGGNYLNTDSTSWKIFFGAVTTGPSIYGSSSGYLDITVGNDGATNAGISMRAGFADSINPDVLLLNAGGGIHCLIRAGSTRTVLKVDANTNNTGIGLELVGNTTKAGFRFTPTTQPTGPNAIGDMYMTTAGVLKVCTVAGSPGTWVSVGAQT